MHRITPLLILGAALWGSACKSKTAETERGEREAAKQARVEADQKAFAIAREVEQETKLIDDEVRVKEAEVKSSKDKAEAARRIGDIRRDAEQRKQELISDATERIDQAQREAENLEGSAFSATPEARAAFERDTSRKLQQIEQQAQDMKAKLPPNDADRASLDGIITQAQQMRQNLPDLRKGDAAGFRASRSMIEKQLNNMQASLNVVAQNL